jgi:hypothetical protein
MLLLLLLLLTDADPLKYGGGSKAASAVSISACASEAAMLAPASLGSMRAYELRQSRLG